VVRGTDGERADLHLTGEVSGAGILIVTGDLIFEQAPRFSGLILVLGGTLGIGPGSGHIAGAVALVGIADTAAATWTLAESGNRLQVSGTLDLERSQPAATIVANLLPPEAQASWEGIGGSRQRAGSAHLYAWSESPQL
jgi:hypothetical protein